MSSAAFGEWLARSVIAGAFVLAWASLLLLVCRNIALQRRIGAAAVRLVLLVPLLTLQPAWLSLPAITETPRPRALLESDKAVLAAGTLADNHEKFDRSFACSDANSSAPDGEISPSWPSPTASFVFPVTPAVPAPRAIGQGMSTWPWERLLLIGYLSGSGVMLARWFVGLVGVGLLVLRSRPADERVKCLLPKDGSCQPRVRWADRLASPICFGLWQPTIVLPRRLIGTLDATQWRWILSHEIAHLKQGDTWTAMWLSLAAVLYYPLPWFWWLRHRLRLCQEYLADAAAAPTEHSAPYADLLLRLSHGVKHRRRDVVHAALGNSSDLYWRITMLLRPAQPSRQHVLPGWSYLSIGSLLVTAILISGFGWASGSLAAAPGEDKNQQPKAEKPTTPGDAAKDPEAGKPQPGERFLRPREGRPAQPPRPEWRDFADFEKRMRQMMQEMQKRFAEQGIGGFGADFAGPFGGFAGGTPGRLGVLVETPSAALVEQLDLPEGHGLVLGEVTPGSAAAKAGLKPNDILLEFNGKPVPNNPQEFRAMVNEIKANTPVDAVVLRKGKRETIKGIQLPEVKADAGDPLAGGLIPLPQFPPIPAAPGFEGVGGGNARSFSIQIANNRFQVQSREDNMEISLAGTVEDGKRVLSEIKIKDGDEQHSYDNLENVPEKYRERIEKLLKRVTIKTK
jgi:hypothetical protein